MQRLNDFDRGRPCCHFLRDASSEDIREFSVKLNEFYNQKGDGVTSLMRQMLPEEKVITIWRSYYGSKSPAIDFLRYLGTKQISLKKLISYLDADERAVILRGSLEDCIKKYSADTLLCEIDNTSLTEISKTLSEKSDSSSGDIQYNWKDIANNLWFSKIEIDEFDSPLMIEKQTKSLTETFIDVLLLENPNYSVAHMFKLFIICFHGTEHQQRDLLYEIWDWGIFNRCWMNDCHGIKDQLFRRKGIGGQKFWRKDFLCRHFLRDVPLHKIKEFYSKVHEFYEAKGGFVNLMRAMISEDKVIKLWRLYHGSSLPAMDFLRYMGTKQISLDKLKSCLDADDRAVIVRGEVEDCIKRNSADTLLCEIDSILLQKIAKSLSEKSDSSSKDVQYTWKDIAHKLWFSKIKIDAFDSILTFEKQKKSMAEMFIDVLLLENPNYSVAHLLKLFIICFHGTDYQQRHLLYEIRHWGIFKRCLMNDCHGIEGQKFWRKELPCHHFLRDVPLHEIKEFYSKVHELFEAKGGFVNLMRAMISEDKVIKLWRLYRGSSLPAMDFLRYMGTKQISVDKLKSCLDADDRAVIVRGEVEDCIKRNSADILLCKIDSVSLEKIAKSLSEKSDSSSKDVQYTWKDIAHKLWFSKIEIDAFDSTLTFEKQKKSMAEMFIDVLLLENPNYSVAHLLKLFIICFHGTDQQQRHLLYEIRHWGIFNRCWMNDCHGIEYQLIWSEGSMKKKVNTPGFKKKKVDPPGLSFETIMIPSEEKANVKHLPSESGKISQVAECAKEYKEKGSSVGDDDFNDGILLKQKKVFSQSGGHFEIQRTSVQINVPESAFDEEEREIDVQVYIGPPSDWEQLNSEECTTELPQVRLGPSGMVFKKPVEVITRITPFKNEMDVEYEFSNDENHCSATWEKAIRASTKAEAKEMAASQEPNISFFVEDSYVYAYYMHFTWGRILRRRVKSKCLEGSVYTRTKNLFQESLDLVVFFRELTEEGKTALEDCTRAMRKVVVAEKQVEVRKSKEIQLTLKPKNIEGSWTLQQGGDQQDVPTERFFNAKYLGKPVSTDFILTSGPHYENLNFSCAFDMVQPKENVCQDLKVLVKANNCPHELRHISYNDINRLSLKLDPGQCGVACKGIMCLMRKLLSDESVIQEIWRSCRGGISPAMDFLHYISPKGITLHTFTNYIDATVTYLVDSVNQCIERYSADTFLYDVSYGELEKIAGHLSVREHPRNENLQQTWKDVAGRVGLTSHEIDALDSPHERARDDSLTKAFFSHLQTSYPEYPVVKLMKALRDIGRNDVISESTIFDGCRNEQCFR